METVWYYSEIFRSLSPSNEWQTEVVNHSLGELLRCVVSEKQGPWDLTPPLVEFPYNNAVNRTTGKSPFKIVHGYSPRTSADLIPLPPDACVSHPTSTFAQHIHNLHTEIRRKIALSNDNYKHSADKHCKVANFDVGDFVMAWICLLYTSPSPRDGLLSRMPSSA